MHSVGNATCVGVVDCPSYCYVRLRCFVGGPHACVHLDAFAGARLHSFCEQGLCNQQYHVRKAGRVSENTITSDCARIVLLNIDSCLKYACNSCCKSTRRLFQHQRPGILKHQATVRYGCSASSVLLLAIACALSLTQCSALVHVPGSKHGAARQLSCKKAGTGYQCANGCMRQYEP
jgi:hypothetical protein